MMRLQRALACLPLLLLMVGTASAQIIFVRPNPFTVSPRPEFLAVADFNQDGRQDIAISSPRSKEVNVLLGNPDGALTPGTVSQFGNLLSAIAAGDLNDDGFPDIVVADERSRGVFIMLNQEGTGFSTPTLISVGRNPFQAAIANFDGDRGNDLAITDRTGDRVTVLLNDGGRPNPRFTQSGEYATGAGPEEIVAGDFNNDGAPDIVTLNQGGSRVKEISVLIFDRLTGPGGIPVFQTAINYGVGERPSGMIKGDFDGDDNLDIAMVNIPFASFSGEVDFLLGQGNGTLNLVESLNVPCPFFTGDLGCRPRAMAAADFDVDGDLDIAVTQTDPREGILGDILVTFINQSNFSFQPGPVSETDPIPNSIAVGDATGDGLMDLFVGSDRLSTIQVYRNVSGSEPGNNIPGQTCEDASDCTTQVCECDPLDNCVCCRTECLEDEICNAEGSEGTCVPFDDNRPNGFPCETGDQCQSTFCTDSVCCVGATCPAGARCDVPTKEGTCQQPQPNGSPCSVNDHCRSDLCVDEFCCNNACSDGRCDVPGSEGECTPPLPNGEDCNDDAQCNSTICDFEGQICCDEVCDVGEQCDADGTGCVPASTETPRCTSGEKGCVCEEAEDCIADDAPFCTDGVCCEEETCPEGEVCAALLGVCATPTPTVPPTSTPPPQGCVCPNGSPCVNGLCFDTDRNGGGCSTLDRPATLADVMVMSLIPLGLWLFARRLRSRAQVKVVQRRDR